MRDLGRSLSGAPPQTPAKIINVGKQIQLNIAAVAANDTIDRRGCKIILIKPCQAGKLESFAQDCVTLYMKRGGENARVAESSIALLPVEDRATAGTLVVADIEAESGPRRRIQISNVETVGCTAAERESVCSKVAADLVKTIS